MQTNQLRRATVLKRAELQFQQAQRLQKAKRPISGDLQAEMDVSRKEIDDIDKAIAVQQSDIELIKERAVAQKKRFLELKNVQPN